MVASARSRLTAAIRRSVPSSKPRYTPIGPSTRCTMRTLSRTKRRRRAKSKLKELKRQAGVPPESRFTSTTRPRPSSARTSASRNWFPPPYGGGLKSWKMARSVAPRRVRSHSASVRPRRASARTGCAALLNKGLMVWEMATWLLTDVLQLGRKLHRILSAIRANLLRFNRGLKEKRSLMRFTKILVLVVLGALVIAPAALALRFTDES